MTTLSITCKHCGDILSFPTFSEEELIEAYGVLISIYYAHLVTRHNDYISVVDSDNDVKLDLGAK